MSLLRGHVEELGFVEEASAVLSLGEHDRHPPIVRVRRPGQRNGHGIEQRARPAVRRPSLGAEMRHPWRLRAPRTSLIRGSNSTSRAAIAVAEVLAQWPRPPGGTRRATGPRRCRRDPRRSDINRELLPADVGDRLRARHDRVSRKSRAVSPVTGVPSRLTDTSTMTDAVVNRNVGCWAAAVRPASGRTKQRRDARAHGRASLRSASHRSRNRRAAAPIDAARDRRGSRSSSGRVRPIPSACSRSPSLRKMRRERHGRRLRVGCERRGAFERRDRLLLPAQCEEHAPLDQRAPVVDDVVVWCRRPRAARAPPDSRPADRG